MMHWDGFGSSHPGLVRPTNQDAFLVENRLQLWVVADGMGGHPGGDVASRLVVETIAREAQAVSALMLGLSQDTETALRNMVESAHRAILAEARIHPHLAGMGTTVTLLHIDAGRVPTATLVHEGDSRAYLLRGGHVRQLTQDHSLVEEQVRQGLLSAADARYHPQRHVLSRALGLGPHSHTDIVREALQPDDRLLLCTDGLTKVIDDGEIARCMAERPGDPERISQSLIDSALEAGGIDNVTVVVAVRRG